MTFQFTPTDGYRNVVSFPTKPANETVFRASMQDLLDQIATELNSGANSASGMSGFQRQALINGNFDYWQRGTSSSLKDYLADRWRLLTDGSGQIHTVSRQPFTPGQTDVPGNPNYFWRYQITGAATGQTFNALVQRVEGASLFAGSKATISFYAKAAADKQITVKATQDFGTGGSPSARNTFESALVGTATATWNKFTYTFTIPSVLGKTFGSDGGDYFEVALFFPNNDTYTADIAHVQFNLGESALPFQSRTNSEEIALCLRYYQRGLQYRTTGTFYNSTTGTFVIPHLVPMRVSPTLGKIIDASMDDVGTGFISSSGIPFAASSTTVTTKFDLGGFTGANTFRFARLDNDALDLAAEL